MNHEPVYINCLQCDKTLRISPSRIGINKYCSSKCYWDTLKGKEIIQLLPFSGHLLGKHRIGTKHSIESRIARASNPNYKRGADNHFWRGGTSGLNKIIRNSIEYQLWRESVFIRDDFTCQECGVHSGNGKAVFLQADHIKPFAFFPELRFAIDNGRTLCKPCHQKTDTFGGRVFGTLSPLQLSLASAAPPIPQPVQTTAPPTPAIA